MKISVCIATHNGRAYFRQQLASILDQLRDGDEVIISDDSSTDRTIDIVRSFNDERIVLLENQTFFNHVYNFENALKNATGEIIIFSDQDDVWLEGKVDLILSKFANRQTPYYVMCTDAYIVDENEAVLDESLFRKINAGNGIMRNIFNSTYVGCCMAFSADILKIALPFPKLLPMHDAWIGLLGEVFGRTDFVDDKMIKYRRHPGAITDFRIRFQPIIQIHRRIVLLVNLILRYVKYRKQLAD